jgi:Na+/melibiose symporter-like transporter
MDTPTPVDSAPLNVTADYNDDSQIIPKDSDRVSVNDMEFTEENTVNNDEPTKRDSLGTKEVAAYAVGHVNNDLCACMWFVYLTWYLTNVVGLSTTLTGYCLLSGQITDGITTPIVGYMSDKVNCPGGRRNFWYYFGFTFVNICFLGIFTNPPFIMDASTSVRNAWYLILPAIFNVGWASV